METQEHPVEDASLETTEHKPVEEVLYQRENGITRVVYGETLCDEQNPNCLLRTVKSVEFAPRGSDEATDILKTLELPEDWNVVETKNIFLPALADSKNRRIVISSSLSPIVGEEKIKSSDDLEKVREKINSGEFGFGAKFAYNKAQQMLTIYAEEAPYFEAPTAYLTLAHEIGHARTHYTEEDTEERYALRQKNRKDFSEKDIERYQELVVEDEHTQNKRAVDYILRMRASGIDLEPAFKTKDKLEEITYGALWSYEQKLYPNMPKLKELVERFAHLTEPFLAINPSEVKSEKVRSYIVERGIDKPEFTFLYGRRAEDWLTQHDMIKSDMQSSPDAILIFNFPKPVAHWWRKKSEEDSTSKSASFAGITEWGKMYEEKIPSLWKLRDLADMFDESEIPNELSEETLKNELKDIADGFDEFNGFGIRINDHGEHDSKNYYYVWGWWLNDRNEEAKDNPQ